MLFFSLKKRDNTYVGEVADRHPNDPSSKDIVCHECEGEGQKIFFGVYDSISEAKDDYPEAIGFTYL